MCAAPLARGLASRKMGGASGYCDLLDENAFSASAECYQRQRYVLQNVLQAAPKHSFRSPRVFYLFRV